MRRFYLETVIIGINHWHSTVFPEHCMETCRCIANNTHSRCRRPVGLSEEFCWQHQSCQGLKDETKVPSHGQCWCSTQNGDRCGGHTKGMLCWQHTQRCTGLWKSARASPTVGRKSPSVNSSSNCMYSSSGHTSPSTRFSSGRTPGPVHLTARVLACTIALGTGQVRVQVIYGLRLGRIGLA